MTSSPQFSVLQTEPVKDRPALCGALNDHVPGLAMCALFARPIARIGCCASTRARRSKSGPRPPQRSREYRRIRCVISDLDARPNQSQLRAYSLGVQLRATWLVPAPRTGPILVAHVVDRHEAVCPDYIMGELATRSAGTSI